MGNEYVTCRLIVDMKMCFMRKRIFFWGCYENILRALHILSHLRINYSMKCKNFIINTQMCLQKTGI